MANIMKFHLNHSNTAAFSEILLNCNPFAAPVLWQSLSLQSTSCKEYLFLGNLVEELPIGSFSAIPNPSSFHPALCMLENLKLRFLDSCGHSYIYDPEPYKPGRRES